MECLSQAMDAVQDEIDSAQVLALDFLERCRRQGSRVRVKDMEPVLQRLGVPLHGAAHFILLLADWENCIESGINCSVADLMDDYPRWGNEIREHLRILGLISRLGDPPCERTLLWRRRRFLEN